VRAFVQDELSKAINPLGNEINRLKREIADLATAKPQPAGSVLDGDDGRSEPVSGYFRGPKRGRRCAGSV